MVFLNRKGLSTILDRDSGEVSERLIELVSKTSVPLGAPRVRIPPSPFFGPSNCSFLQVLFYLLKWFQQSGAD